MMPLAVSWSMIISMKRICGVVRLRLDRNSENASCAAARSMPTMFRTKWASEGESLRAKRPVSNAWPSPLPISTSDGCSVNPYDSYNTEFLCGILN